MSRIAGIVTKDPSAPRTVARMLAVSRPATGWNAAIQANGSAALGWTGWRNPEVTDARGILVALDGHIYNDLELGTAPLAVELIAALYRKHGFEDMVQKLNGDFAIALYDSSRSTLWLARDRFGVKPLYYTTRNGDFAFASRLRSLLLLPGTVCEPRREFVGRFAGSHYRYIDNDPEASPFRKIQQLPASTMLRV